MTDSLVAAVTADHREITRLVDGLSAPAGRSPASVRELTLALLAYQRAEQQVLYPIAAATSTVGAGRAQEGEQEHAAIRRALAQVYEAAGNGAALDAGQAILARSVHNHVHLDEQVLLPTLSSALQPADRDRLAEAYTAHRSAAVRRPHVLLADAGIGLRSRMLADQASPQDAISLLVDQHTQIDALFDGVFYSPAGSRRRAFCQLRHLLCVHEMAEQVVIHPCVRRLLGDGRQVARTARLEKRRVAREVRRLAATNPESTDFTIDLQTLRETVANHATREESIELLALRLACSPEELEAMGKAVRTVQRLGPTRAHPWLDGRPLTMVAGAPVILADRAADAACELRHRLAEARAAQAQAHAH